MATIIKHTLQRDVFLPAGEQLMSVVHVTKPGKKKKTSFLCVAATVQPPAQVHIYQVKKLEKEIYKKKLSWALRELKTVNIISENGEFDIQFEKLYKWIASNTLERNAFVKTLHMLSQKYTLSKPKFLNASTILDKTRTGTEQQLPEQTENLGGTTEWEYQALTSKEEADLETLMSQVDNAIGDAEGFVEQLSKDISVLDGANVHSIMGSEDKVQELMLLIDKALVDAEKVEEVLDSYDKELEGVKDLMEITKEKEQLIHGRSRNHQLLLDELESLVKNLDLSSKDMKALLDADLSTTKGVADCSQASKNLLRCMTADVHPAMREMTAVQEQQKKFTKVKANFSKRLCSHINNLFIHQGNELMVERSATGELRLYPHQPTHTNLTPFTDMMFWLKECEKNSFEQLTKVYTSNISKLYEKEVKEFMQGVKVKLQLKTPRDTSSWFVPSALGEKKSHTGSSTSLNREAKSSHSGSGQGSQVDLTGQTKFDQILEYTLKELSPYCLAEQNFCVKFFHIKTESTNVQASADDASVAEGKQKKLQDELRRIMSDLFPNVETELVELVNFGHRIDSFNSLYMLVRLGPMVMTSEDTNSFLIKVLGSCLVQIRKNFDTFVKQQIHVIKEIKALKKSKIGILPFVHQFEEFSQQAETIFKEVERRNELDKAYIELLTVIFQEIQRLSLESHKVPSEVIVFENCHRLVSLLSQLKVSSLEAQRKEAKQLYQEHMQRYVTAQLGRPMEKLNVFFEGIQGKVASGVKEEEVGYQLAYSKQELRKNIKEYPGKEVKKSLEHLYKRVEKHLCEEENLLQVVWHSFQDEFLKQYKHFDQLIARCYPGSGITLEFTINDVLLFFSDIAQSH